MNFFNKDIFYSIAGSSTFITILGTLILICTYFFPEVTHNAFTMLYELLPSKIADYLSGISLEKSEILSFYLFISACTGLSLILQIASIYLGNYRKISIEIFSFFLSINTVLLFVARISYRAGFRETQETATSINLTESSSFIEFLILIVGFFICIIFIMQVIVGFFTNPED